jgi:hypothetical protein
MSMLISVCLSNVRAAVFSQANRLSQLHSTAHNVHLMRACVFIVQTEFCTIRVGQ